MVKLSHSEEETKGLGREIGKKLKSGDIVALFGELGAGKTTFIKGICQYFGIIKKVKSPSFTVVREYNALSKNEDKGLPIKIFHIDLYRIHDPSSILLQEAYEFLILRTGICLIEWADRIEDRLPTDVLEVRMKIVDENTREIKVSDRE